MCRDGRQAMCYPAFVWDWRRAHRRLKRTSNDDPGDVGNVMRLGLLADIHEHTDVLRVALNTFRKQAVGQIVVLGDVVETGEQLEETCRLLAESGAVGVWGNHDYGFCQAPDHLLRRKYAPKVVEFMSSLRPRLEIRGCLFSHVEPWLDPEDVTQLWYFEGPPDTPQKAARSFKAAANRIMFTGHLHRWMMASPGRILQWSGQEPVQLDATTRYLILVAAVCDGRYAIFDTKTLQLVPFNDIA